MGGSLRDIRFAVRALGRAPVLFGTAIMTLAVGIGLATGVVAIAYGLLLRPLPYPEPDRLVVVDLVRGAGPRGSNIPLPEFDEWQRRLRTFEHVAAYAVSDFTLRGAGPPRSVRAALVTDGFFEALGIAAKEGTTGAIRRGVPAAAFSGRLAAELGPSAWREQGVAIGVAHFSVVAVMPDSFTYPGDNIDLWLRGDAVPGVKVFSPDDQRRYQLIGRLGRGITIEQARDDVRRVALEIDAARSRPQPREWSVVAMKERGRGEARAGVLPFVFGAALVLLIASANVSGLLVGRVIARRREFAIRRALGGGFVEVFRASLAETLIVALCGWGLAWWVAYLLVRTFDAAARGAIPNLQSVRLDLPVLIVSLLLAIGVAVLSGGAPAARAARTDPAHALRHTSDRAGGDGGTLRGVLVVAQIAMALILLITAGLLMRTVVGILSRARSFEASNALTMRLMLTETVRFDTTDRSPTIDRMLTEIRRLPGVMSAGVGSDLPPNGSQLTLTIRLIGENRDVTLPLSYAAVTPGYLEALSIQPLAGRLFEDQDRHVAQPVVVITETAAKTLFPDREAVGLDLPAPLPRAGGKRARPRVIGVVRDVEYGGLDRTAGASIFTVWETLAPGNAHLVVRTSGRPLDAAPAVRRVVQEVEPTLPIFTPQTLEEVVAGSIADRRLRGQLALAFAALALLLAAVAIWGAIAQNVLQRRREIAVRRALGATDREAIGLIVRSGFTLTMVGIPLGIGGGIAAARGIRHLLHGVAPMDPISFGGAVAITVLISLAACYVPARRAAAISPAELLRE